MTVSPVPPSPARRPARRPKIRTVIVGAGLSGLEIAKELACGGVPGVQVLEAGPEADLRHANVALDPPAALRLWLQPETDAHFRQPWRSDLPPAYTGSSGIRQRVGGRSLYWYGVCLRLEDWALADPRWPAAVVGDLCGSWRGGESLYARVERQLRQWQAAGQPAGAALGDTALGDTDLGDASQGGRLGSLILHPTPCATRRSGTGPGRWYAYSPLDTWRDPETGDQLSASQTGGRHAWPPGIELLRDVRALRIIVKDRQVRAVQVRRDGPPGPGTTSELPADQVVLAAGTLENTRLAIQALHEAGALATPRLPGLCDHLVQGVFARLTAPQAARLYRALPAGAYYARCPARLRSNLFLELSPLDNGGAVIDLQVTGEQLPAEGNYVACEPGGAAPWPMRVHATVTAADIDVLQAQREILRSAWAELAQLTGCRPGRLGFADYRSPARTNELVLPEFLGALPEGEPATWSGPLGTEDHEGGTLPLGVILTDDHQVGAVRGLFAAGPCTFPRMGAANPSLTTLALAHRLAAILAGPGSAGPGSAGPGSESAS